MSKKTTTRPRGFAAWNPTAGCLALIEKVLAVLAEYGAYLPLTYERLGEKIARACRAGIIDFGAIRDDGSDWRMPFCWKNAGRFGPVLRRMGGRFHARPSGREVLIEVY